MLKHLFLRWFVYLVGIRIYRTEAEVHSPEFREAKFSTVDDKSIIFTFHKETLEDLRVRYGKVFKRKYHVYVVRALFDERLPDTFTRYNNLKFHVRASTLITRDEIIISDILADIYLSYLYNEVYK